MKEGHSMHIIGKGIMRKDSLEKVTGHAKYTADFESKKCFMDDW